MKNFLLLICLGSLSLQAQFDPLNQYLNRAFIPNIAPYDSITFSTDTGAAFSKLTAGWQHYFTNGKIDTLTIEESGINQVAYKGQVSGDSTEIIGYDISGGMKSPLEKVLFVQNTMGLDSLMESYAYQNGFQLAFQTRISHQVDSLIDDIQIFVQVGASLMNVGRWGFYYDQQRLDSIYFSVTPQGGTPGFYEYYYDPLNPDKLETVEIYQDVDNDGEEDLIQLFNLKHNAANEVTGLIQYNLDQMSMNLVLAGEVRYDIQSQSTIGLPESLDMQLEVYPNPAADFIKVNTANNYSDFSITDFSGQLISSGKFTKRIEVADLPAGHYILSLSNASERLSTLFVKQ